MRFYLVSVAPLLLMGCLGEGEGSPANGTVQGYESPKGSSNPLGPDSGFATPESANQPGAPPLTYDSCLSICVNAEYADYDRGDCEDLCDDVVFGGNDDDFPEPQEYEEFESDESNSDTAPSSGQ